jgi:hypothetical protein
VPSAFLARHSDLLKAPWPRASSGPPIGDRGAGARGGSRGIFKARASSIPRLTETQKASKYYRAHQ